MTIEIGRLLQHIAEVPVALQFVLSAAAVVFTEDEIAAVAIFGLARSGEMAWPVAIGSVFFGAITYNIVLWWVGRVAGTRALHWKMFRKLHKEKLDSIHHHVQREGWFAVAVARFIPGIRIPVVVLAGILGMNASIFIPTQIGVTLVWMLAALGLMHLIEELINQNLWFLVALVVVTIGVLWFRHRKRASKVSNGP